MKLKCNPKAIGLAICIAMVIVVVLALTELIFGWGVIWGFLAILLYPMADQVIKIWKENNCRDLEDLLEALKEPEEEPGDLQSASAYPYY